MILVLISCIVYSQAQKNKEIKSLHAYPNPFSQKSTIALRSAKKQLIILTITNLSSMMMSVKEVIAEKGDNNILFNQYDDWSSRIYNFLSKLTKTHCAVISLSSR